MYASTFYKNIAIGIFLLISTTIVYFSVLNHEFLNFDDELYVTKNKYVLSLNQESIIWAFTDMKSANWHPLTWLSHMLDVYLYKLQPGGHHFTNLLLHLINSLLLFSLLFTATASSLRSGFVACLFALHPLHVESVAWVSERKDVLSTFFFFLALLGYIYFVKKKSVTRYLLVLSVFCLGLMSKTMLVTLPFVFLLFDYWPLRRFDLNSFNLPEKRDQDPKKGMKKKAPIYSLVVEKAPFFALSFLICLIALKTQNVSGAMGSLESFPFHIRFANALNSYCIYIIKMFYPVNLAPFYPYQKFFSIYKVVFFFLALISITYISIKTLREHPYFIVGWFWYLGTLVPVIGLIQIGEQSMADRYTYIPLIGLFIIASWGSSYFLTNLRFVKKYYLIAVCLFFLLLMKLTTDQVNHWKNSITLFEHTLRVSKNNLLAHINLAHAYSEEQKYDKALTHYQAALAIKGDDLEARTNLALTLVKLKRFDEAKSHLEEALKIDDHFFLTHFAFGNLYFQKGLLDEALNAYSKTLKINPNMTEALNDVGHIYRKQGLLDKAIEKYKQAMDLNPQDSIIHNNLGVAFMEKGLLNEAIDEFKKSIELNFRNNDAHSNLGSAFFYAGKLDDSIYEYKLVSKALPNDKYVYLSLGIIYAKKGLSGEARSNFNKALLIDPELAEAKAGLKNL